MTKISFVYFDVGGVAIQDFSNTTKWDDMLIDLGLGKFDRSEVEEVYDSHDDAICLGHFRVEELIPIYQQQFGITIPKNFDLLQYFVDHFNPNYSLHPIAAKLKAQKKVGLLTDMYPDMLSRIRAANLLPPIAWDAIVDSSVEGVRKPMPEIYQLAQTRAGVPDEEILFIDNREKNLVVPRQMGWQTFLYDSSNYDQANKDLAAFLQL